MSVTAVWVGSTILTAVATVIATAGVLPPRSGEGPETRELLRFGSRALIDAVAKAKPSTAKGKYMKKVNLASTMSPGVLLDETAFAR